MLAVADCHHQMLHWMQKLSNVMLQKEPFRLTELTSYPTRAALPHAAIMPTGSTSKVSHLHLLVSWIPYYSHTVCYVGNGFSHVQSLWTRRHVITAQPCFRTHLDLQLFASVCRVPFETTRYAYACACAFQVRDSWECPPLFHRNLRISSSMDCKYHIELSFLKTDCMHVAHLILLFPF